MGSKFKELMKEYGKVKQFPMDATLMPLSEEQTNKGAKSLPVDPGLIEEDPQLPEFMQTPLKKPNLEE